MPVQDGIQASGTATVTATTSAVAVSAVAFNIRATCFQVTASTTNASACFIDTTAGLGLATSSASYPMGPGEALRVPLSGGIQRLPAFYSGFSIATSSATATVRYIALR